MRRTLLILVLPLSVLVCTGIATALISSGGRDTAEQQRSSEAGEAAAEVRERLDTTVSRLSTTAGLFAASTEVTEPEFRRFAQTLLREPTIDSVAYVQRVPADGRAALERRLGLPITDGVGTDARRAPKRAQYFPYVMSATAPEEPRTGLLDAGGEPSRAAALRAARDVGLARTTGAVRTFGEGLPTLIVYAPIYKGPIPPASLAQRRRTLRGYAVGILPLRRLLPVDLARTAQLVEGGRRLAGPARLADTTPAPLQLAGRRFQLRVDTGVVSDYTAALAVAIGGSLLALAIGIVVMALVRRDEYAQRVVAERLREQRQAEAALAESERRHRLLAETSSDWIALIDPEGRWTYSSPSVRDLLGRDPEELIGRPVAELIHPEDSARADKEIRKAAISEDAFSLEVRACHSDGRWIPLDTSMTVIRGESSGEVVEVRAASRDASERLRLEGELRRMAVEDALTGLPNRRGLHERVEGEVALSKRYGGGALVLLDLDEFKEINDTQGHSAGDQVLKRVAVVLQERLRESDHVARLGGDEFAAVLPRVDRDGADKVAEDIRVALRSDDQLLALYGRPVTASIGIAMMKPSADGSPITAEVLLARADQAMYVAKRAGRDRTSVAPAGAV